MRTRTRFFSCLSCLALSACLQPLDEIDEVEVDELDDVDQIDALEEGVWDPGQVSIADTVAATGGNRYDFAPADKESELRFAGPAAAVYAPPSGWSYDIYRDVYFTMRSSCLPGTCAPNAKRVLDAPSTWDGRIFGNSIGFPYVQFKWKWYAGEYNPRTGQPYESWVPTHPYFAVQFFWGCADAPSTGSGAVNDESPCAGGARQVFTTGGVASYGAPYFTSGRYLDGWGPRPCWDLPAISSPSLGMHTCHLGPNQQFQFNYSGCSTQGERCSVDTDCCYHASGGCDTYTGTCRY
jgi:hypothetical protein